MKIITVPHKTLRLRAQEVLGVDKKLQQFIKDFELTLSKKDNPRGVGLAAPQVNTKWRIFATQLPVEPQSDEYKIRSFINPRITDHSENHNYYGPDKKEPFLEGCLSIPGFYGPVPRWQWLDLTYDYIDGNELKTTSEHFDEFGARVVQHEYDHLDGVLFIDYTMQLGLPLYKEKGKSENLVEIDQEIVLALAEKAK